MAAEALPGMSFASLLKGRLGERIIVSLLERGGFRVTRLGIEEIFDEIHYLPKDQYLALNLPPQLRALPDILITDTQVSWAAMIEIKFRRRFDAETVRELHWTLSKQREHWPQSWAVIMIAEPFVDNGRFHQDYIRMIGPDDLQKLVTPLSGPPVDDERRRMERYWDRLPMLTKLFYHAHADDAAGRELSQRFWAGADFITAAIKDLRNL